MNSREDKEVSHIGTSRNPFKILSFRDWLYIPHILSRKERALVLLFVTLAILGGIGASLALLAKVTHEAPAAGGTYREGLVRAPERINPLFLSSNDTDRDLVQLIYSKIFSYDAEGNLQPDLAESYSVSPDGKSYTINLRKDVTWHDGKPLTADDVTFTIKSIQDPSYKSSLRPNWQGVTAERLGNYSVRFVLKQPYSPFIQNLSISIIPKHVWEKIPPESASLTEFNLKPVGSGPYRFKNVTRDASGNITDYILEANSNYYREGPYIKAIEFTFYDSEEALIQAYQSNLIDGISVVSAKNVELLRNVGASITAARMPRIFAVFLNDANPALKDKNVREALAMAIPRDELIAKVLGGGAIPIDSPIPPGTFGYNSKIVKTPYDVEGAKALLEKAGWKDFNKDGLREKKTPKPKDPPTPLKITLITSDWSDLAGTAKAIKEYWRVIGVDTEAKILSVSELENSVIRPRRYDALLFGEILGRDPDPFAFWHSSQLKDPGLNIALYHSSKVDSLLEDTRKITDKAQVQKKYEDFQQIVASDFPSIFLYSPTYFYAHRPGVHGIELNTVVLPSERLESVRLWYMKTKHVF